MRTTILAFHFLAALALASSGGYISTTSALPALTGDVTSSAGSAATTLAAGSASNLNSGTLGAARLPNPSASTLGGIQSYASVSNQWINAISTSGVPSSSQPATTNISDITAPTSWSPVYSASGSSGITYATQQGRYSQVGGVVFFWFDVKLSGGTLGTTGVTISLPSTAGNVTGSPQMVSTCLVTPTAASFSTTTPIWGLESKNQSSLAIYYQTSSASVLGVAQISGAQLTTASEFVCHGMYYTN